MLNEEGAILRGRYFENLGQQKRYLFKQSVKDCGVNVSSCWTIDES